MDNPTFVHDEDIPLIDDDYDEEESRYDTLDSSRIEETSFIEQPAVRLRQRNRLLRNYLENLYKYLNVDGNIDLVDTNLFKVEKYKNGAEKFSFYNGEDWVSLTNKRTGKFLSKITIRNKFGGIERMKRILSIEGDIPDFNQSVTFAKKLQEQLPTDLEMEDIPLLDLGNLAEQVHIATREAATNTDLDMREFLGIDKALRRVQGEIINNTAKLSELDKKLARDREKLEEIKNDPLYSEELKNRIQERIDNAETERDARLEVLSMNKKELRSQISRIKETITKILDSDTSLAEKLRTLFREQGITLVAIITAIGMIISTIVVSLTGGGGAASSGGPPPKDNNKLIEWFKDKLKRLSNALKRLAGKAVGALPGIIGSIFGAILNFLAKAVGFAAKYVWTFLVFIVGAVATWLYTHR